MEEKLTGEDMGGRAYHKYCRSLSHKYRSGLNSAARNAYDAQRKFHKNLFAPIACPLSEEEDLVIQLNNVLYLSPPRHNSKWTFQSDQYQLPKTK